MRIPYQQRADCLLIVLLSVACSFSIAEDCHGAMRQSQEQTEDSTAKTDSATSAQPAATENESGRTVKKPAEQTPTPIDPIASGPNVNGSDNHEPDQQNSRPDNSTQKNNQPPETASEKKIDEAPTDTTGEQRQGWDLKSTYAISLLGFGVVALVPFLIYVWWMQARFYSLTQDQANKGSKVSFESVPLSARVLESLQATDAPPPILEGPVLLTVGEASTDFTVKVAGQDPTTEVSWSILPADAAVALPSVKGKNQIIAAKPGAFQVVVSVGGQSATLDVAAVAAAPAAELKIPFIGEGFASFYIALVILILVATLGILDILTGEAIATIMGALAGYIFGIGQKDKAPKTEE